MTARRRSASVAAVLAALAAGCGDSHAPGEPPAPLVVDATPSGFPAGGAAAAAPARNALTEARAQLGHRLFYDPMLSRTNDVSCSTCHEQRHAFADPKAVSTGTEGRQGTRNAPALVNLAWSSTFFWDGRAASLEEQAGMPIENPVEMDLPLAEAVGRVAADARYTAAFDAAYGGPPTTDTLRFALASFLRALVSAGSPYDRHLAGDDAAFGAAERRGEQVFFSERGACFHCHPPGSLTNGGYFNDGSYVDGGDRGRQVLTNRTGDLGKFKVPALRNVAASAPYMHDGSLPTLEDVVAQYDRGGRGHASTDPQIQVLALTEAEKADLLAFLRALSDDAFLTDARFAAP
jgi:cytochrome c peroxidase